MVQRLTVISCALSLVMLSDSGVAQTFDPITESPLQLLHAPSDGIAYLEMKQRARSLLAQGKATEAEPLAERVVREYPRDPDNWLLLARAKRGVQKHAESAAAFERAGILGGWMSDVSSDRAPGINAVVQYAAAGDRRRALDALRREVYERRSPLREDFYDWPGLESLRNDREFLEILKRPETTGWSRNEGWKHDIDYLYRELQRTNSDYRNQLLPAEITARYEALKRDVVKLSDEEILVGMRRMIAPLHQGHVALFAFADNRLRMRQLPVQLYGFPDGVYIVDALPAYRDLIGARITSVEATPVDEALRLMAEQRSVDGDMEYLGAVEDLTRAQLLKGTGIAKSVEFITITVSFPHDKRRTVKLATVPLDAFQSSTTSFTRLRTPNGVAAPLYMSRPDEVLWEQLLPEHSALYVHVRNIIDDKDESLWNFGLRLREVLAREKARNLIIDVRHNNGGSTNLYTEFLRTAIGFSQVRGNQVFVLIGRRTYSATANLVTELDRLANAVFVGEATSACCNFHGDPQHITLPYSGIQGELTAYRWGLTSPWDGRREMSPDVPVQLTAAAFFAGKDPVLETVLRIMK